MGEYLDYWLTEIVKPNLAPLTYATYETFVRLYIVPGLGAKRLDRLRVSDVQTWINEVAPHLPVLRPGQGRRAASRTSVAAARSAAAARTVPVGPHASSDIRAVLRVAALPRRHRRTDHQATSRPW